MKAHYRPSRALASLVAVVALVATLIALPPASASFEDVVVVANRGSGDISVIHTSSLRETRIDLPGAAQPMYVNQDRRNGLVLVGDRAASKVVALDQNTFKVRGTVSVGEGVFHQWYDETARQLWVVGDTSQTVSVVDTSKMKVLATIHMPTELVDAGGKPHDVFVAGDHAFVSMLGLDGGVGAVLQYSTSSFAETGRITVGDDPHLFVQNGSLYIASQEASKISRHNASTLAYIASETVPTAHGLYVTDLNQVLVTNIRGGGSDAVNMLDPKLGAVRAQADTPFAVPHNITVDKNWHAWVTHSGASASHVSAIDFDGPGFGRVTTIEVGTNPFGLAFVDR